jgi:hypothetical protein
LNTPGRNAALNNPRLIRIAVEAKKVAAHHLIAHGLDCHNVALVPDDPFDLHLPRMIGNPNACFQRVTPNPYIEMGMICGENDSSQHDDHNFLQRNNGHDWLRQ